MSDHTYPPWTQQQVDRLNEWQACDWVHEFTCPNRGDELHRSMEAVLIAREDGWHCSACAYHQTWAHEVMLHGAPPRPMFTEKEDES